MLVVGVMLMMANVGDAGDSQKEFGKSRRYDAKQCVMVEEELMIVKKKTKKTKFLAVFDENKCSRPIQAIACFQVISSSTKHPRNGWHCNFEEYKSRSRTMILDRGKYGRVKKWAGCKNANEDCIRIINNTEASLNSSGQDPEKSQRECANRNRLAVATCRTDRWRA